MPHLNTKITVVRASVCDAGRSPEGSRPRCKKLCFSAKPKPDTTSRGSLSRSAMALGPDRTERFRSVQNKTEIDKRTHQWRPEGDERAAAGIGDSQYVLGRGRRFCARRLLRGALSSEAAGRVTSFLASWLKLSRGLPGCARARLEHTGLTTISIYNFLNNLEHLQQLKKVSLHTQYYI